MPRTDATKVGAIVEVDEAIPLDPFIETANALVTEVCVPLGYDSDRLELIERWLSAHFYRIRDQAIAIETAGDVAAHYQFRLGLVLHSTMYGQNAMILDTKGGLAALSKQIETGKAKRVPSLFWAGTKDDCCT